MPRQDNVILEEMTASRLPAALRARLHRCAKHCGQAALRAGELRPPFKESLWRGELREPVLDAALSAVGYGSAALPARPALCYAGTAFLPMKNENQREPVSRRRVAVRYDGHVQGVGFRFTVVRLASRLDLTGYVLNEYDGSVRLVAEGAEQILLDFLRAIRLSSLGRYLTGETASWSEATGEFDDFGVKF